MKPEWAVKEQSSSCNTNMNPPINTMFMYVSQASDQHNNICCVICSHNHHSLLSVTVLYKLLSELWIYMSVIVSVPVDRCTVWLCDPLSPSSGSSSEARFRHANQTGHLSCIILLFFIMASPLIHLFHQNNPLSINTTLSGGWVHITNKLIVRQ